MGNKIDTNIIVDGQLAVATAPQTGTIIESGGEIDATALVQTENGPQLAVKTVAVSGGGGGGGAAWGAITGNLSDQTDLKNALDDKQATLVSGTNIKTVNNTSLLGSGNISIDSLPSQTGQSGKFLTTDGTDASWASVSVPANVYTQDNLVAGTNISLDQVQISGGIDENTLVLLHFDGNNTDSSPYSATTNYTNMSNMSYADSGTSFGQYLTSAGNADQPRTTNNSLVFPTNWDGSCTIDFRIMYPPTGTNTYKCNGAYILTGAFVLGFAIHYNGTTIYLGSKYDSYIDITSSVSSYLLTGWNHIAVTYDGTLHTVKLYINGILRYTRSETINFVSYPPVGVRLADSGQSRGDNGNGISEVRVSSNVRYTGDFTPPTAPYTSSSTTATAINNTMSAPSVMTGATSSLAGTSGLVPAPAAGDQAKYLTGAGTWEQPSGLQNTAAGLGALAILGTSSSASYYSVNIGASATNNSDYGVNIGYQSKSGTNSVSIGNAAGYTNANSKCVIIGDSANASSTDCVAIGQGATAAGQDSIAVGWKANVGSSGDHAVVIGSDASATNTGSIQLGYGTNNTAGAFYVGIYPSGNYQLLNSSGKIPADRLGTGYDASKTQVLKNVQGVLTWVDEA